VNGSLWVISLFYISLNQLLMRKIIMSVFKRRASVRQNANQGPRRRWQGHFVKRWGIDSFSAFLTTALLSCCLLFTGLVQAAENPTFQACDKDDMRSSTHSENAVKCVDKYATAKIFGNDDPCFKEQKDTFVYILFGALEKWADEWIKEKLTPANDIYFTDIERFHDAIKKAVNLDIITKMNDRLFHPIQEISRVEALSITVRAYENICNRTISHNASPGFNEAKFAPSLTEPDDWMDVYMNKGYNQGLTSGYDNKSRFDPLYQVPRHESVAFVEKLIKKLESCSPIVVEESPEMKVYCDVQDFGDIEVGSQSSKVKCEILNDGGGEISNIKIITNSSDFYVVTNNCEVVTEESCSFYIKFEPSREGTRDFSMEVSSSAGTKHLNLSGNGIDIPDINLRVDIDGDGTVTGTGINCGRDCSETYDKGDSVTLNASPSDTFIKWQDGDCDGETSSSCDLVMNSSQSVTAVFDDDPCSGKDCTVDLTVVVEGDDGKITNPEGKVCEDECSYSYDKDKTVTVTANKNVKKWSGCDNETKISCTVDVGSSGEEITAVFETIIIKTDKCEENGCKLKVNITGNGTVTGTNINCVNGSDDCDQTYSKEGSVTLMAVESSNDYKFARWDGDCNSSGKQCVVNIDGDRDVGDRDVIAIFELKPIQKYSLTVRLIGNGTVKGRGIDCGSDCSEEYEDSENRNIALEAILLEGSTFEGWKGDGTTNCGKNKSCTVLVDDSSKTTVVTANFAAEQKYSLIVNVKNGDHSKGKVTGGIDCEDNCSEEFKQADYPITLKAVTPNGWSSFVGWENIDGCDTNETCSVPFNGLVQSVKAKFKNDPPTVTLAPSETLAPSDNPNSSADYPDNNDEQLERNFIVKWKVEDKKPLVLKKQIVRFWEKGKKPTSTEDGILKACSFKKGDGSESASNTDGEFTCTPNAETEIKYNTWYTLEVTATDDGNASTTEEWSFKTRKNLPPYPPITMSHCDKNAEEIEAKDWQNGITLTWERPNAADYTEHKLYKGVSCEANPVNPDCENNLVTYLVYFQGSVITCGTGSSENSCIITPDKLGYGEKYSWQVFPTDKYNGEESARNNAGNFCDFETSDDQKPEPATNPFVNDLNNEIALTGIDAAKTITLKATGNRDPDGDDVTYQIHYGEFVSGGKAGEPDLKLCEPLNVNAEDNSLTCEIPVTELEPGKVYIWQVITATEVPVAETPNEGTWQFTTSFEPPPPPQYVEPSPDNAEVCSEENAIAIDSVPEFAWTIDADDSEGEITFSFCRMEKGKEVCINPPSSDKTATWLPDLKHSEKYEWWVKSVRNEIATDGEHLTFCVENAEPKLDFISVNGGEQNVLLKWEPNNAGTGTEAPDSYNIYRVAGDSVFFDANGLFIGGDPINGEEKVLKTYYTDNSLSEDDKGKRYCYFVNGYLGNTFLYSTNLANGNNCVDSFGSVELELPDINVPEKTLKEIPITMPYPGDLVIVGANICVGYDKDVIEFEGVGDSIFASYFFFDDNPTPFDVSTMPEDSVHRTMLLDSGVNQIVRFSPLDLGDSTAPVEELIVQGDHPALLYMKFRTKQLVKDADGNILKNKSVLKFINFYADGNDTDDIAGIAAIANCSNINADFDGNNGVPIDFSDGNVEIENTRRGNRNGDRSPAHVYVRDAYQQGDVNGNGVVEMMDFREAYQIQGSTYEELDNPEKWAAANVAKPSDEQINEDDVNAILNQAAYGQTIPRSADTGTRRMVRRKTRDGNDDNPIVFSISDINGVSGDEVIATISATNLSVLSSMGLTIAYNTDVISEIVKVSKTGLTSTAFVSYNPYDNAGLGRISVYSGYNSPIEGSGDIAEITLRLAEGGTLRSTSLFIAQATLYDKYGRNFELSALERVIKTEKAIVIRTDVPEAPEPPEKPEVNWVPADEIGTANPALPINIAEGQIVDSQGNPMVDILITVGEYTTITKANGDWVIYDIPAGEYLVTARKASDDGFVFMEKTCIVGNGENCHIEFVVDTDDDASADKYALYGTVVDRDGFPIKGATVKTGDYATVTDKTGFFVFLDLVAGEYYVTAKKGTEELGDGNCVVGGDSNCKLDFYTHLDQSPEEVDPKVEGIYGVQITVKDDLKQPIAGVVSQIGENIATTDETGYCEFTQFTEGEYMLTASKDGYNFAPVSFELGNQQLWTKLTLRPLTELKASIVPRVFENAEQGKHFTYIITATNGGNKVATAVSLEYPLPDGTELVEVRGDGVCEQVNDGNTVMCTLPDLVTGASAEVEIEVKVIGASNFSNVVILTSNEYPVNKVTRSTTVKPYLSVFGTAKPSPIVMNGTLHYEFAIELNDNASEQVATGVQLEIQLPKGVALVSVPDNCEVDELVLTCQINDLSIVNPDDTSQIMFNLDVVLEDPGMIKLITKAEVTADNYPNHASKTSTEVNTQGIEVDAVILFDLTWSMTEEWAAIIREVNQRIKDGFANGATPFIAIVGFRDYNDIKLVTATRDIEVLLQKLKGLKIEGGGQCPEASADAFILALNHLKQGGTILLITDAPPYDDVETKATLEKIKEGLISKEVNFVPLISVFDCSGDNLNQLGD